MFEDRGKSEGNVTVEGPPRGKRCLQVFYRSKIFLDEQLGQPFWQVKKMGVVLVTD
jgi:hypothetical protein